MTDQPISNEVALRIALAARALPDVSVGDLIEALQTHLDELTEESLGQLTVTQLKRSFGNIYEVDEGEWEGEEADNQDIAAFKDAVRILWGEKEACEHPLPIEPYEDG
ncbi:MAG: dinitrogenase iron-molybdenum cofactor N-terminal domain-containing protein, partial [Cyanobacteria bacterium J06639_14]